MFRSIHRGVRGRPILSLLLVVPALTVLGVGLTGCETLVDTDGDGIPNVFEKYYGLDPADPDQNLNSIKDGDEDPDGDDLTTSFETLTYQGLNPNGYTTNPFDADSDETVLRLIAETFNAVQIRTEPEVPALLRDILGNDREVTRRELEKLSLYAAESKLLTTADVLALCADNAALVLDEVADAVGTGRPDRLDAALGRALAAAVNPQQLLAALTQHFTQLRRWRTVVDSGASVREVLDGARPKPHFSRRAALEQQLRLWPDASLALALDRLLRATGDSRKNYGSAETLTRRTFLALAQMAAQH